MGKYLAAHLKEAHGTPVEKHWLRVLKMKKWKEYSDDHFIWAKMCLTQKILFITFITKFK